MAQIASSRHCERGAVRDASPSIQTRRGETVTGRPPGCESGGGSSPRGMHNTRWSRTGRLQAHASYMGDETPGCRWGLPAHHSSSEPRQISPFRGGPRRKHPALTRSVSPQNRGERGSQRRGRDGSVGSKRCRAALMREREQSLLPRPPLRSSQSPFQRSLRLQSAEPAPATAQTQEGERRMLRSRRRLRPRRGCSGSEAAFSGAAGALCGSSERRRAVCNLQADRMKQRNAGAVSFPSSSFLLCFWISFAGNQHASSRSARAHCTPARLHTCICSRARRPPHRTSPPASS